MLKRTLTGTVIVAAVYCTVFFSEKISWLLTLGTALLTAAAIYELFHAANIRNKGMILLSAALAVAVVISPFPGYLSILGVVFSVAMIIFGVWMTRLKPGDGKQWWIYPTSAAVTLLFKAISELNQCELIAAITVCFLTDVAAYLVGSRYGKHYLARVVSPHKTLEGSAAGLIAAVGFVLIYGAVLSEKGIGTFDALRLCAYALPASAIAQFGDLTMSTIKRSFGVKDFGNILPGHGGVLDRFDSHIFCVAFTLLFSSVTGGIFR